MIKLKTLLKEHNSRIVKISNSKSKREIASIRDVLKNATWTDKEIDVAVAKYKKEQGDIEKKDQDERDSELPKSKKDWTYDQATGKQYKEARKKWDKKYGVKKWNEREYRKWIKSQQGNGGKSHSHDMAQNAKHENGLLAYVQKQIKRDYGDESPLERIQWDIES